MKRHILLSGSICPFIIRIVLRIVKQQFYLFYIMHPVIINRTLQDATLSGLCILSLRAICFL